jgi:hypothetical protein
MHKAYSCLLSRSIVALTEARQVPGGPAALRLNKILPDKFGTVIAHHENPAKAATYR